MKRERQRERKREKEREKERERKMERQRERERQKKSTGARIQMDKNTKNNVKDTMKCGVCVSVTCGA